MTSVNGNISQRKDDYDGMPEEVQIEEFKKKQIEISGRKKD